MAINTEILQKTARERYGLDVTHARLLGVSENHAFELKTSSGEILFARVHTYSDRYASYLPSEFDLLDHIAEALPDTAPSAIRTKDGACYAQFDCDEATFFLMLFSWLHGTHRTYANLTPEETAAMAGTTARFHQTSREISHNFNRPVYDFEFYCGKDSFYNRHDLHDYISTADMEPFLKVKNIFKSYSEESHADEKGMIHYDLHLGNFLFEDGRAQIIDFDECGHGYYLFDLGHILFALQEHNNHAALESVFIERYEAVTGTKLPRNELQLFKGVQAVAIVHYFFRLYDRSAGKQNLFHIVPGVSKSLHEITTGLIS